MLQVNIHEANTNLSRLLESVSAGEEIVIARAGQPIARLLPWKERKRCRVDRRLIVCRTPESFTLRPDLVTVNDFRLR